MDSDEPSFVDVEHFLRVRYAASYVLPLSGGEWSAAFTFESAGRRLVARFGQHAEDYAKDEMAGQWATPSLPTPRVLEVGEALGGAFAISEQVEGDALDRRPPDRMAAAIADLLEVLGEIRAVPLPGSGFGCWRAPDGAAAFTTWAEYLASTGERDDNRLAGWRERLAAHSGPHRVFTRLCEEVRSRAPALPERRELVHGDLLAGNVLIDSHDRVAGVIDWGNSLAGDPAFDPAWLMFWAPWHPGIDPAHIGERALDVVGEDDIAGRLLCYQLHIAADGLQYQAFAGEIEDLYATADHAERLLRGS